VAVTWEDLREGRGLLLITGRAKSGTTWMSNILRAHPQIAVPSGGRQELLLCSRFEERRWMVNRPRAMSPKAREFYQLRHDRRDRFAMLGWMLETTGDAWARSVYVCDKSPDMDLRRWLELFPQSRAIVMLRDLRDVCVSAAFHYANISGNALSYFTEEGRVAVRADWVREEQEDYEQKQDIAEYLELAERDSQRVRIVRYERLESRPMRELRALLQWLDVNDAPDVARVCLEAGSFRRYSGGRARGEEDPSDFYRRGVSGDWENHLFRDAAAVFDEVAGKTLVLAGYESDSSWVRKAKASPLWRADGPRRSLIRSFPAYPLNRGNGAPPAARRPVLRVASQPARRGTSPIELYAIFGVWHEGDIIEAAIANAKHQGCSRVFVIDNDSPDDTVARAEAAGAEVVDIWSTDFYEEGERLWRMNELMDEVSRRENLPHLWWLYLDGDEFPKGPFGMTIREYLQTLDERFQIVGAIALDHYPTQRPYYARGLHPIDTQPYATLRMGPTGRRAFCPLHHWKHPLFRVDNGTPDIFLTRGSHTPVTLSHRRLLEPEVGLCIHHCPLRAKEDAYRRLELLCGPRPAADRRSKPDDDFIQEDGAIRRYRSLDAIYEGRWDDVLVPHSRLHERRQGVRLRRWQEIVPAAWGPVSLWYSRESATKALTGRV